MSRSAGVGRSLQRTPPNDRMERGVSPAGAPRSAVDRRRGATPHRAQFLPARQAGVSLITAIFAPASPLKLPSGPGARLGRRRVGRWVRRIDLPDLNTMASKPCTPAYFGALLARRWAEGITKVRHLFAEIRHRGYTGSYSHLARFLAPWRSCEPSFDGDEQVRAEQEEPAPVRVRTLDPMTGRAISPLTAAALCIKPRGQMTARQVANVDALKAASAE